MVRVDLVSDATWRVVWEQFVPSTAEVIIVARADRNGTRLDAGVVPEEIDIGRLMKEAEDLFKNQQEYLLTLQKECNLYLDEYFRKNKIH